MKLLTFHNGGTLIGLEERERERESAVGERGSGEAGCRGRGGVM